MLFRIQSTTQFPGGRQARFQIEEWSWQYLEAAGFAVLSYNNYKADGMTYQGETGLLIPRISGGIVRSCTGM